MCPHAKLVVPHLQAEDDAEEEGDESEEGQQRAWDDLPASAWPLVATFRDVLDLLNTGLPEPFLFGRRLTPAAADGGDELGELGDADVGEVAALARPDVPMTSVSMAAKEVDMEAFLRQYWPHFNQARCWSGKPPDCCCVPSAPACLSGELPPSHRCSCSNCMPAVRQTDMV